MTLKYFQRLSESLQYRRLLTKGVCIAERIHNDELVLLFQLDLFYVEITFHNHTDELMHARSFDDLNELTPYLDLIKLPQIA